MTRTLKIALLLLTLVVASLIGWYVTSTKEKPLPPRLSELPARYQYAAKAVASILVGEQEEPKEFRAEIEEKEEGEVLVFHLWHDSAYSPENDRVIGNPGGKCRDIIYDVKTSEASRSMLWQ